jgi:L-rhamnose-H+ transport protein
VIPTAVVGIPLHWLGGLASGSFYVPYRAVRMWSWEIYWLLGGVFSWLICPALFAATLTESLSGVIASQSVSTLWWTYFFGVLWGFGGLSYGLTMRYLGLSLGTGVALGFCAAFGTLMPPTFKLLVPSIPVAESIVEIAASSPGRLTLCGVAICFFGIALTALAGLRKERELPEEQKRQAIAEFSFFKGMLVATFCGVMSACFAFALTAGNPIGAASVAARTEPIWSGLPKLVVLLWGGFTTNFVWCLILIGRHRSGNQYFATRLRRETVGRGRWSGGMPDVTAASRVPLLRNYLLSAVAGTTWYLQFFFYTMGETQMGKYAFASWTLHMASIIIFATAWGWILREWNGSSRQARALLASGVCLLIASTIVIGWGAYLKAYELNP